MLLRQSRYKWKARRYPHQALDSRELARIQHANPTGFFNESSGKICLVKIRKPLIYNNIYKLSSNGIAPQPKENSVD